MSGSLKFPTEDVLDKAIKEILNPENPDPYSTIPYITRTLRQFHLSSRIEAGDILFEAYMRGKTRLRKGTIIRDARAWLRVTAFNIIREKYRKLKLQPPTDPDLLDFISKASEQGWISQTFINSRIDTLWEALDIMKKIQPENAELLHLKYIDGLSWREVRDLLAANGNTLVNEETLRKRASRAIKQLRQIFHQVESDR
ncbi:MAG: sigma-70 family RNA polymerase sigma factor [Leptolyngbyaceae cyanobacterium MO_188.B28]|nr:sigma-70 family RNA polymerase sigma factor [Leptolyngbyaceae cyanobacterium MO_188.B28]